MASVESVYRTEMPVPFDEALERAVHELGEQGLGVITWIDMKDKLAERLGADFRSYVVMGVFDPDVARRALEADLEAGLVITTKVIVYEAAPGRSGVAALRPGASLSLLESTNPDLQELARDTDSRLRAAIQSLEAD